MSLRSIPFVVVALVAPVLAIIQECVGRVRISERHHSTHDTYVVSASFTRALALAMVFSSAVAILLTALADRDVFVSIPLVPLAFFDAFVITCLVARWLLVRYKVSAYGDRMLVTPFVGHTVKVRYQDIERLEWVGTRKGTGFRDLDVIVGGRRAVRLSGIVDLEQVLLRVDRFDVLEPAE